MEQGNAMSVEAQLAVLNTKIDTLIEFNKQRGEDHEARIRRLEDSRPDYITKRAAISLVVVVCTVVTAAANFVSFLVR